VIKLNHFIGGSRIYNSNRWICFSLKHDGGAWVRLSSYMKNLPGTRQSTGHLNSKGRGKKPLLWSNFFALPVLSETKPEYAIYGVTYYSWAFIKWGQKFELMRADVDHVLIHLTTEVGNKGHKRVIFSRVGGVIIQVSSVRIRSHAYLFYPLVFKIFFFKYIKIIFFYFIKFIFNINIIK
jgi:hypothetical protein